MAFFGGGRNLIDTVHIANFVHASILLMEHEACSRKIYFVSDDQPVSIRSQINDQLEACGFEGCTRNFPKFIAHLIMTSDRLSDLAGSRSAFLYSFRTQTFSDNKIRDATGYQSIVTREEGLKELADWCRTVGGPEPILTGRRRGEALHFVQATWNYLMDRSVSINKVIAAHSGA